MKIAAQLYTLRNFTQTPEEFLETLKKVKEIGYESIQISGCGKMEPEFVKECLDETGLSVCVTHTAPDRILNDTDAVINEHKLWDCNYIGLGSYPPINELPDSELKNAADEFIKTYLPAMEKIKESGLMFLYHNHANEFRHVDKDKNFMEYVCEKIPADKFGIIADFYWTQIGGANAVEFIETYGERLKVVHFKDLKIEKNAPKMAPIGEGNINYKAIYEALKMTSVEAIAVEQDDCYGEDPFDCLKRSYNYLKEFIK